MLTQVTIFGERCSGTNYLEELIVTNFDVQIVSPYCHKHFFGFNEYTNSEDVLCIGIIRNITDWVNSLYREKHHLPKSLTENVDTFLKNEMYSIDLHGTEIMEDRNIETKERYKNIFELRHIKNRFLIETAPKLLKHYLRITYDELLVDFTGVMNQIKNCNIPVKYNIEFPINITYYKKEKHTIFTKKQNEIPEHTILEKANLLYETSLFPNVNMFNTI